MQISGHVNHEVDLLRTSLPQQLSMLLGLWFEKAYAQGQDCCVVIHPVVNEVCYQVSPCILWRQVCYNQHTGFSMQCVTLYMMAPGLLISVHRILQCDSYISIGLPLLQALY